LAVVAQEIISKIKSPDKLYIGELTSFVIFYFFLLFFAAAIQFVCGLSSSHKRRRAMLDIAV
jgi:hypothetical protein